MATRYERVLKTIHYYKWLELFSEVIEELDKTAPEIRQEFVAPDGQLKPAAFWWYWTGVVDQDVSFGNMSSKYIVVSGELDEARQHLEDDPEWNKSWIIPVLEAFVTVMGEDADKGIHIMY